MARPKLGADATDGVTAKMEVRVPASLRDAAEATLDVAKKETLSAFVREAMEREVKRRSKRKTRSG
jgi:hypothetical protein